MSDTNAESGLALVSVLWLVLLLSLMLSAMLATARVGMKLSAGSVERAQAEAMAEAALSRALLGLLSDKRDQRWQPNGRQYIFSFAGGTTEISIHDEAGKIDLNSAADELIKGLFKSVGLDVDDSARLTDAIGDWRDTDSLRRPNGAEAGEYRAAGLDHGPRNGPFEVVGELRQVLGMTDELFRYIEPALTLYSGRRTVDSRVAPALVKNALGLLDEDDRAAPSGGPGVVAMPGSLGGRAYTIRAEVPVPGRAPFVREVTVRVTENPRQPYWLLDAKNIPVGKSDESESCKVATSKREAR